MKSPLPGIDPWLETHWGADPVPVLKGKDAEWAAQLLQEHHES